MEELLKELVSKYPAAMAVIIGVGVFRVVFKPIFAALRVAVQATPSESDDALLDKVEASKPYKVAVFVVDYLLSIKLPGSK